MMSCSKAVRYTAKYIILSSDTVKDEFYVKKAKSEADSD